MHKNTFWLFLGCFLIILFATTTVPSENIGTADMVLEGGSTGKVPFPHHRHQKALNNDCQICHKAFPREKGVIFKLKQEKVIDKKSVMNACQACHKDLLSQGKPHGPTKCKECHSL